MSRMKRSCLAVILASLMLCTVCTGVGTAAGNMSNFQKQLEYSPDIFLDISEDAWYYSEIANLYCYGLTSGVGNNQFSPDGLVSIAEVITYATRIHSTYYGS